MKKRYWFALILLTLDLTCFGQSQSSIFEDANFIIENAAINTPSSDFGATIIDKELIFNSFSSEEADKGKAGKKSFYELFSANLDDAGSIISERKELSSLLTKYHEGPLCYNYQTKQLFLTQSNWENPQEENIVFKKMNVRLGIVIYEKNALGWQFQEKFPYNSNEFSIAHPAINVAGDTLIFVSDMPGGLGETDLYYCAKVNGKWSKPVNLGSKINTPGKEMFPFFNTDGTLIFASDGHGGQGKLDIFYTKFSPSLSNEIKTFGNQINTEADDFGMIIASDQRSGFFVSNRDGGVGDDDIYSFKFEEFPFDLIAVSNYDESLLPNTEMKVLDQNGVLVAQGTTDGNAKFPVRLRINQKYKVIANNTGFMEAIHPLDMTSKGEFVAKEEKVYLQPAYGIKGQVVDILGNIPIPDALVIIKKNDQVQDSIYADYNGEFSINVQPDLKYNVAVSANNYFGTDVDISTIGIEPGIQEYYFQLYSLDAGTRIQLKNIYFDLDKYNIRADGAKELDRLASILEEYPDLQIMLESHTDSRGSDEYNMELSQKRAKSTFDYLVSKGIDPDRLEYKGFGESQLVNGCKDGVDCPEEMHAENRRTVVEILKSKVTRRSKGNIFYF